MFGPPGCTARASGGPKALAGSWQLAHDCLPDAEYAGSMKMRRPRSLASISEAGDGQGTVDTRRPNDSGVSW